MTTESGTQPPNNSIQRTALCAAAGAEGWTGEELMRVQARMELVDSLRAAVEPHRRRWNPERALGNPAHVMVVDHDEASSLTLLCGRLAAVVTSLPAFEILVGTPCCFASPVSGVFLKVSDPSASAARSGKQVLVEPFRPRSGFGLRVTILHPDQGDRLDGAWPELSQVAAFGSKRVHEVVLVDGSNELIDSFRLVAA